MTKKTKMKRIGIPKELFEIHPESGATGTTVECGYGQWPDWAKKARDARKDMILFCPCDDSQDLNPKGARLQGRMTVIREHEKGIAKGARYNKDVYRLYENEEGEILQEMVDSKKKADHWMKEIRDEYRGWPKIETHQDD